MISIIHQHPVYTAIVWRNNGAIKIPHRDYKASGHAMIRRKKKKKKMWQVMKESLLRKNEK